MKRYKLGELIEVTRGASLSGKFYSTKGDLIRLTLGNFDYAHGGFKKNASKENLYFTGEVKERYILQEGDIITPLTEQTPGLLGSTARIPESGKYVQSQDVALIRCKPGKIDPSFCYYLVSSSSVKKQLGAAAQQTKIRHTSPDKIKDAIVDIPSLEEQKAIGYFLDTITAKIENAMAINDYLEAVARQLYDYWFVQFDFPDKNGKPYKSSGGKMVWNDKLKREIPEGWEVARLSDYIEEHISGDWGNDNPTDGCMQVSCIRGADMKTMEDLPIRFIQAPHTDRLLHEGDIVIEMSGGSPTQSTGRSVCVTSRIIGENKGCLICSNFCHALVIKAPYKYYFHFLWQKLYENGVMFNFEGKTSGLRNLQLDSLCSSYWFFPPTEEEYLEDFNMKINAFLGERDNNKHAIKALERQRSMVLPLLMNGQVSVRQLNNHLSAD